MQLLNLSTRTLKEEEEDDSPSVISSSHPKPPIDPSPPSPQSHHYSSSPIWFILSVYGWAWIRLLYAIYSKELEDIHCTTRMCMDDIGMIFLLLSGLTFIIAAIGLLRWSSLLITPFLITQSVWTGGLAGAIINQSFSVFTNVNRLVHVYAFCLLSLTVLSAALIGIYLTLRSMDFIRRTPSDKRKGRIELFANPLFSPDASKEIARCDVTMNESMPLSEFKTPPSLINLFEDTHETQPNGIFDEYAEKLLA